MKLKLNCLLSVCLLMGSCSGGTSGNVSDSGTSAYPSTSASPSSNPDYTSSNPSTPTYTPSTSGTNSSSGAGAALAAQNAAYYNNKQQTSPNPYTTYSNDFVNSFASSNCSFSGGTYDRSTGKCK